jgi:hypothetical protein
MGLSGLLLSDVYQFKIIIYFTGDTITSMQSLDSVSVGGWGGDISLGYL